MATLSPEIKKIPSKLEFLILSIIFLSFPYSIFAFKLFPNGDCYNAYVNFYHYIISSILDNQGLPFWDPIAAGGSPIYLVFLAIGILEPFFWVSIFIGKIFSLNVFQVYMTWIVIRNLPILIGMFWLLKQTCRHSVLAIFGAAFVYYALSLSLLRDGIVFVIYWPLLLAVLIHFVRLLKREQPTLLFFYAAIILLAISLLIYNPAYTLVFLGSAGLGIIVFYHRNMRAFYRLFLRQIKIGHRFLGLAMLIVLLLPAVVLLKNYRDSDQFALVRVHHAYQSSGRIVSGLWNEPLDYLETDLYNSPMRRGREFSTCLFPFFYNLQWIADGSVYFGFLGVIGILAGILLRRSKIFLSFLLAAVFIAFFMTWSSNGLILFARPFLPFLKLLNQRQLLFPAFVIFAVVCGCLGLKLLLEYCYLKKIEKYLTFGKVSIIGILLVAGGVLLVSMASFEIKESMPLFFLGAWRMYPLCLGGMLLIAAFARLSVQKPKMYGFYLSALLLIFVFDCVYYFEFLTFGRDQNSGILAHSRMMREKLKLDYQPFRSPLLPYSYGGTRTYSVVHQLGLRSALPAYWHSDISFSSTRYYRLISLLDFEKLKGALGVSLPIVNVYYKSEMAKTGDEALAKLFEMDSAKIQDTLILEKADNPNRNLEFLWEKALFNSQGFTYRYLPSAKNPGDLLGAMNLSLFDRVVTIPQEDFQEVPQGLYHRRLFRIRFPEKLSLKFDSQSDLVSRYFFPEFPIAIDFDGRMYFFSPDRKAVLKFVSGQGMLVESNSASPVFPKKVYVLEKKVDPAQRNLKVADFGPNHITIEANTPTEGILSYADLYDKRWRATLDGQPVPILISNYAFKAVQLPAGKHTVEFRYHVPFLFPAIVAYFLCILGFCSVLVSQVVKNFRVLLRN